MNAIMHDKIVLITGGTGGIGKETAIGVAKLGATVVITGRNSARGEAAVAEIQALSGNQHIHLLIGDLSKQNAIRTLAQNFKAKFNRLDVLINNAGLLEPQRRLTADHIEANLAVNVIAPFLLTHELLDILELSKPSRVINVTGGIAVKIDLSNLQAEKSYLGLRTYSHAKMIMMAMSYEFAKRVAGTGVNIAVAYPGTANTEMTRNMTPTMVPLFMRLIWPLFGIFVGNAKPAKAAQSSINLAYQIDVNDMNGHYFDTNSKDTKWPAAILDEENRQSIWQLCEELTDTKPSYSTGTAIKASGYSFG